MKKNPKEFSKIASFFWTIGNFCNLWFALHSLKRIFKEKTFYLNTIEKDPKKAETFKDTMKKLDN